MVRKKIDTLLGYFLSFIMAVMVLNVLWQVFTRFVLNSPSSFTDELARYLMIWIGVLGAAYLSGKNGHVAIDLISSKLSVSNNAKLEKVIALIICLFVFAAFIIGGSRLVYITATLKQYSPTLHIPLAIVYAVIPFSGLLIIYYKISDIFNYKK